MSASLTARSCTFCQSLRISALSAVARFFLQDTNQRQPMSIKVVLSTCKIYKQVESHLSMPLAVEASSTLASSSTTMLHVDEDADDVVGGAALEGAAAFSADPSAVVGSADSTPLGASAGVKMGRR